MNDAGNPQKSFRTIHVVGTNGKGSTTALLAEILHHLGYKAGRITSPHLLHYRERTAINNVWIPEEAVIEFVDLFRERIEKHSATFFEITTVMSAWFFEKEGVDFVVAEAGLGGRLDATRLLDGECTLFTGIELEHRRILGSTEPLIAAEKVAITRRGSTLIAFRQKPEVENVITLAVKTENLVRIVPEPADMAPSPGEHQKRNAGLALSAALMFSGCTKEDVQSAFKKSCKTLSWPGRLDLRSGSPSILFDVAHSPGSVEYLVFHLKKNWKLPVPAVVGFLEDKFWKKMTEQLCEVLNPVITTTPLNERSLPASSLAEQFQKVGVEALWIDDIGEAMKLARSIPSELTVVTGSFFVVGYAMHHAWRNKWIALPEKGVEQNQLFQ
jgi:dihydrofolate synthase/folylpolyglutamate synthase